MKKQSLWLDTSDPPAFPKLQGRVTADVVVVGGGITGLTTAYLLKKAGCRVAVLDQRSIGGGETAHTTAHVTFVTDTRLHGQLLTKQCQRQLAFCFFLADRPYCVVRRRFVRRRFLPPWRAVR